MVIPSRRFLLCGVAGRIFWVSLTGLGRSAIIPDQNKHGA
jgi:hypothetical protein